MLQSRSHPNQQPSSDVGNGSGGADLQHSADNPKSSSFSCEQCGKTFNRPENLSRHQKTHDAVRLHRCSICGKEFTRSDLRKRHEAVHTRKDGVTNITSPAQTNGSRKRRKVESPNELDTKHDMQHYQTDPQHAAAPNVSRFHVSFDPSTTQSPGFSAVNTQPLDTSHSDAQLLQQFAYSDAQPGHYDPAPLPSVAAEWRQAAQAPFDFSSVLMSDPNYQGEIMEDWFTGEFYAAIRETGNGFSDASPLTNPTPGPADDVDLGYHFPQNEQFTFEPNHAVNDPQETAAEEREERLGRGRISRISSPPNEASEADKWPLAWDPRTRPVLNAKPIIISDDHPLFKTHDPTHDILETTYQNVVATLNMANSHGFYQKSSFYFPTLPVTNLLIGLFFKHFYPQMPVLHLPTFDINGNHPPQLIAVMIVIGAIYSYQKHTRRFSIVLLDLTRRSLHLTLEYDNTLFRDLTYIYALTLSCHAGLWCGNKRIFEFAEVMRGTIVSHSRRNDFWKPRDVQSSTSQKKMDLDTEWRNWIREESAKRLCWVIYTVDAQSPSLLNLPSTISASELSDLGCPCDDEFWLAPTARHWKRLLGPASVPPSRSFATAIGPFFVPFLSRSSTLAGPSQSRDEKAPVEHGLPVLSLNPWSRFLVLLAIHVQIFEFSQDLLIARNICGDDNRGVLDDDDHLNETINPNEGSNSADDVDEFLRKELGPNRKHSAEQMRLRSRGSSDTEDWDVWYRLSSRKKQLSASLVLWSETYGHLSGSDRRSGTSTYHHECSRLLNQLGRIILEIPLTDLQNSIGKSGPAGIPAAMSGLKLWAKTCQHESVDVALTAVRVINSMMPTRHPSSRDGPQPPDISLQTTDTGPYGIITLLLCHVNLYIFTSFAQGAQKLDLLNQMQADLSLRSGRFFTVMERVLLAPSIDSSASDTAMTPENRGQTSADVPKLIFRNGADSLTRMGTWGCALTMALMCHSLAEM